MHTTTDKAYGTPDCGTRHAQVTVELKDALTRNSEGKLVWYPNVCQKCKAAARAKQQAAKARKAAGTAPRKTYRVDHNGNVVEN